MSSMKAFRFQLRLAPAQQRQLQRWAGGLRWVWNQALAEQRARHARGERYASYAEMCKWLTAWRNAPDTQWLAGGPVHTQQQALKRLDEAYKRFFAAAKAGQAGGRGRTGPPEFKRRGQEPGIRYPDAKQFELDAANGRIKLPKLGWLRLRMSQPVTGELRNVSVTREGARWHVSIQVLIADALPAGLAPSLGIDLGLTQFAALSTGELVPPLKALARQQCRLRRYQRSVSRKKKGSANRLKAVARLGNLHRKIARQRSDWLHKLSTGLADRHPVIALEDLKVKNMSASARGTAAAPGKRVRQKAGLNRGILDAAWGEFTRQLGYKTQWRGGQVILVNPAYTSRTCRVCAHECAENRQSQSSFICVACGHTEHADVHAAKNSLAAGHAAWARSQASLGSQPDACGGDVRRGRRASAGRAAPTKQEPSEETCRA
jgi:putative transposase